MDRAISHSLRRERQHTKAARARTSSRAFLFVLDQESERRRVATIRKAERRAKGA